MDFLTLRKLAAQIGRHHTAVRADLPPPRLRDPDGRQPVGARALAPGRRQGGSASGNWKRTWHGEPLREPWPALVVTLILIASARQTSFSYQARTSSIRAARCGIRA